MPLAGLLLLAVHWALDRVTNVANAYVEMAGLFAALLVQAWLMWAGAEALGLLGLVGIGE